MEDKATKRLHILKCHVAPSSSHIIEDSLAAQPTGTSSTHSTLGQTSTSAHTSSTYASATGQPSSYARVHGEVSKAPVQWRSIASVSKETLQEVKYEKSVGEGIAKVSWIIKSSPYPQKTNFDGGRLFFFYFFNLSSLSL
jgi:hypothetical protein